MTVLLRRFVGGELAESESNEVIDVLVENDESMDLLDKWMQQSVKNTAATFCF